MIIVSFNINGIRSHIHQIKKIIEIYNPYFIALQETKVSNDIFPKDIFENYNYNIYLNGYKNHYGVALMTKAKAKNIYYDFSSDTNFKYRIIIGEFELDNKILLLINVYVPQGENINNYHKFNYKILFIENLINYVKKIINNKHYILILGDINISPYDIDIGINKILKNKFINNGYCSFSYKEILMYKNLIKCGLIDVFRQKNLFCKKFTWFNYIGNSFIKNEGLRIDMFLSNKNLYNLCNNSNIDYFIRSMIKSSDHAPIWSEFNI